MNQRVKPWQLGLGALAVTLFVIWIGMLAARPAPIRSQAPAGKNPIHYEIEFGPREGQLEAFKQAGLVPPDAVDNGKGSFVAPSTLTPAELKEAEKVVRSRERRRTARSRP